MSNAPIEGLSILFVVTNADLAGAPIHVRDLAVAMVERGARIRVVFGEDGPVKDRLANCGIRVEVIPTLRSSIRPVADCKSIVALRRIAKDFRPDLIHAHSTKAGMVARCVGAMVGVPVVYTVHGWGFGAGRKPYIASFVYIVEHLLSKCTAKFIAVSEYDKKIGLRRLQVSNDRIVTIYNGSAFVTRPPVIGGDGLVVTMVARNEHPKDYLTLFKSISRVEIRKLRVVGKGTDSPEFIALARENAGQNENKIEFVGESDDVEGILENSTVFVLSSWFEGLPISVIEAMSKGLPVIGSRVGGVPELISHGVNGFTFEAGDHTELAQYLARLSDSPALRLKMGEASLARFREMFDLRSQASRTCEVYKEVLSGRVNAQS